MQCIFGFGTVNPEVLLHKRHNSNCQIAPNIYIGIESLYLDLCPAFTTPSQAVMAFAMQTPMCSSLSFKSHTADARPFLASRPAPMTRKLRTAVISMAKGPSLKTKNNIAKVLVIVAF